MGLTRFLNSYPILEPSKGFAPYTVVMIVGSITHINLTSEHGSAARYLLLRIRLFRVFLCFLFLNSTGLAIMAFLQSLWQAEVFLLIASECIYFLGCLCFFMFQSKEPKQCDCEQAVSEQCSRFSQINSALLHSLSEAAYILR